MQDKETTDHSGSTFDSFLEEEGMREAVDAAAIARVTAWLSSQPTETEEP